MEAARFSIDELRVVSLSIASNPPFSFILAEPVSKVSVKRTTPFESILSPPFSCSEVEPCKIRPFGVLIISSSERVNELVC